MPEQSSRHEPKFQSAPLRLDLSSFLNSVAGRICAASTAIELGAYHEGRDHAAAARAQLEPEYSRSLDCAPTAESRTLHLAYQRILGFEVTAHIGLSQFDKAREVALHALEVDTADSIEGRSQQAFLLSKLLSIHSALGETDRARETFDTLRKAAPVDRSNPEAPHLALAKAGYSFAVYTELAGHGSESDDVRSFALAVFAERERVLGVARIGESERTMHRLLRWTAEQKLSPRALPPRGVTGASPTENSQ